MYHVVFSTLQALNYLSPKKNRNQRFNRTEVQKTKVCFPKEVNNVLRFIAWWIKGGTYDLLR